MTEHSRGPLELTRKLCRHGKRQQKYLDVRVRSCSSEVCYSGRVSFQGLEDPRAWSTEVSKFLIPDHPLYQHSHTHQEIRTRGPQATPMSWTVPRCLAVYPRTAGSPGIALLDHFLRDQLGWPVVPQPRDHLVDVHVPLQAPRQQA
jgi:hypothetical protein